MSPSLCMEIRLMVISTLVFMDGIACLLDWLSSYLFLIVRLIDWLIASLGLDCQKSFDRLIDWLTVAHFLPEQLAVYTWKDATLKELSSLVRSAHPDARLRDTFFEFSLVFPDFKSSHYRSRHIGTTRNGMKGQDDNKTLADVGFQIGNYLTVQIIPPNHEDAKRFWRIRSHFSPWDVGSNVPEEEFFLSRSSSELGQQSTLCATHWNHLLVFFWERSFLFHCLYRMARFL